MYKKGQEDDTNDTYEGFTLSLALVDAIPVILFSLMGLRVAEGFQNPLFTFGVILIIGGGACKVLWKILLAAVHQDIHWLNRPLFLILMPGGFLLALLSVICSTAMGQIAWDRIFGEVFTFPSLLFFILGILGIAAMVIFTKVHDKTDARNNWVEQITNSFAQLMFLLGVLLL